jgi:hypothetical protein
MFVFARIARIFSKFPVPNPQQWPAPFSRGVSLVQLLKLLKTKLKLALGSSGQIRSPPGTTHLGTCNSGLLACDVDLAQPRQQGQ